MLEILVIVVAILVMARKTPKRRRRMGRYLKGNVDESLTMTTLAGRTLVSAVFDETVNERTFVSSVKASWSLSDMTQGAGIGPILVGVAHSDYTDAEIEEVIENTGSWNEGDLVSREIGARKVRQVGSFRAAEDGSSIMTLEEGRMITTKLGWILLQGQSLRLWAYNTGSNAIATTVPILQLSGHVNLWPR